MPTPASKLSAATRDQAVRWRAESRVRTPRVAGANWAARSGHFDAVICLGAVIRGDTAHFEYVAGGATDGSGATARGTGVPVIFGVLTVDNVEQALSRAGGKDGHKGEEAAQAAIAMANLRRML